MAAKLLTPLLGWAVKVKSVGLDARNGRLSLIALSAQSSHESIWIHLMNRFRYTQLWSGDPRNRCVLTQQYVQG
jgi:hypothetical protein